MYKTYWLSVVALSAIVPGGFSMTPVAGKCRTFNMTATPVDMTGLAGMREWELIYVTDTYPYPAVDNEVIFATPIDNGAIYRVDERKTLKNGTVNMRTYIAWYTDNVALEEVIDDDGTRHHYRLYPLALSVDQAMLYYRCSEMGDPDLDTRSIEIPRGRTISEAGLKYLLEEDKKYNFRGDLYKLPQALVHQKE